MIQPTLDCFLNLPRDQAIVDRLSKNIRGVKVGKKSVLKMCELGLPSLTYCTQFLSSEPGCGRTWTGGGKNGDSNHQAHLQVCAEF